MDIVPNPLSTQSGDIVNLTTTVATPTSVPQTTPIPVQYQFGSSPFQLGSTILSQAPLNRDPIIVPEFPTFFRILPQQAYEPTLGNDAILDTVLSQWYVPNNSAGGYVTIDLEYTFGVIGNRSLTNADYVDPRVDSDLRGHMITAVKRVKALRPNWKVGFYTAWMSRGLGMAKSLSEHTLQLPSRTSQRLWNDNLAELFNICDFVAPSFYDRNENVGLDKLNCSVRDTELASEVKRAVTKSGATKLQLFAMVSPFTGPSQTGTGVIDPQAVTRPMEIVKNHGWNGVIWWGNCASNNEYYYMLRAIDRVQYAMKIAKQ